MTAAATDDGEQRSRTLVVAAFTCVVLAAACAGLILITSVVQSVTRSNDAVEVLNIAAATPSELLDSVAWQPDAADMHRDMEPLTRLSITDAWLRGWSQLLVVAETERTEGLEVYFSNSALQAIEASSVDMVGHPVRQLGHDLALHFYSEDGSVAGFESRSTRLLRRFPTETGDAWFESDESYDVVMLLEDGNWRVQHWIRRSVDGRWLSTPPPEFRDAPTQRVGNRLRVAALAVVLLTQVILAGTPAAVANASAMSPSGRLHQQNLRHSDSVSTSGERSFHDERALWVVEPGMRQYVDKPGDETATVGQDAGGSRRK